jgi:acetate kinase
MIILVLNSGSSSLKFQVIDPLSEAVLIKGIVDGIGLPTCTVSYAIADKETKVSFIALNHDIAVQEVLKVVEAQVGLQKIDAIGHRVVHGGEYYHDATVITDQVIAVIDDLKSLAPLHNPPNLAGILACKKLLPDLKQVAVFDTAFHQTMPPHSYLYALPYDYYQKYKIRKYGFHGTSHKYVSIMAKRFLKKECNLVTCHLGNGSSISSIRNGKSVDTSMGFTPLQGLIMGTRSGSIDPEIVPYLAHRLNTTDDEVIKILNKQSGLKGICGYSDVRTIHEKALAGDKQCLLALDMLSYDLGKNIAAFMAAIPKVDAIVFTAGIGQGATYVRAKVCDELRHLGVTIDLAKNKKNKDIDISSKKSKVKVLVIPTNEELMIAKETGRVVTK